MREKPRGSIMSHGRSALARTCGPSVQAGNDQRCVRGRRLPSKFSSSPAAGGEQGVGRRLPAGTLKGWLRCSREERRLGTA